MKKYIFLILLLNINISYGAVPLGYKNLTAYCHYFDPDSSPSVEKLNMLRRAYCIDKSGKHIKTLVCCQHSIGNKNENFWISTTPSQKGCPLSSAKDSPRCDEVY